MTVTACAPGCDSCIMSGAGLCDGPRCNDGYYINSNKLCTSQYQTDQLRIIMINFDAAENVLNDLEFTDVYSNVQGRLT